MDQRYLETYPQYLFHLKKTTFFGRGHVLRTMPVFVSINRMMNID